VPEVRIAAPRQQAPSSEPFHSWPLPSGKPWAEFHRLDFGYLIRFPELADFVLSDDATTVTCHPVPGTPPGVTDQLYLNQVLPLSLSKQGILVFHASSVEIEEDAVAFVAESGRGKSTLAASFATEGFRFLTDDGLVIRPENNCHYVWPSHPSLRLRPDSEAVLIPPDTASSPASKYAMKSRFLAGPRLAFCSTPRRLRQVFFLGDGSASSITFRRLSGSEVMLRWLRHSFLLDLDERTHLATHFEQLGKLAGDPGHFALDFPRRFDQLAKVRRAIVDHVKGTAPTSS
jgi:hypothetical protein